jgi:hypothetical protein
MLWATSAATDESIPVWRLPGRVHGAAFSHDGKHLALGNANGTIYVLRLGDGTISNTPRPA